MLQCVAVFAVEFQIKLYKKTQVERITFPDPEAGFSRTPSSISAEVRRNLDDNIYHYDFRSHKFGRSRPDFLFAQNSVSSHSGRKQLSSVGGQFVIHCLLFIYLLIGYKISQWFM